MDGSILFIVFFVVVAIAGLLSYKVANTTFIIINIITAVLSLLLAFLFMPNGQGWFKPLTGQTVVIVYAIISLILQSIFRLLTSMIVNR